MNIYVANLAYEVNEEELFKYFEEFGKTISVTIIKDKYNDQTKGFGFVEMLNMEEAEAAIKALNGADLKGQPLFVNKARSKNGRRNSGGRSH